MSMIIALALSRPIPRIRLPFDPEWVLIPLAIAVTAYGIAQGCY